ncbi:MAG: NifU family protein [Dehalococcoidia bacterium]
MTEREEPRFQQRMQRIEGLIKSFEVADPATRARAEELVQLLLELHGTGLERVLDLISETGEPGMALIDELAGDELCSSLLLLHDLHPFDLETRIARALEGVRPYLASHGGNVELLELREDGIRLRLEGSGHGCGSSTMTLKNAIEAAVYAAAPDLARIEVEGVVEEPVARASGFVPIEQLLNQPTLPRSASGDRSSQPAGFAAPSANPGLAAR